MPEMILSRAALRDLRSHDTSALRRKAPHLIDHVPMAESPLNDKRLRAAGHRLVWEGERRRKVCIVGAGYGRSEAPLDDPTYEVWALNLVAPHDRQGLLRADLWFDLHQKEAQTADDLRWIAACPCPIYVPPDLLDDSANAVSFPLAEIEKAFGARYWACTFSYQIALAMWCGWVTDLGLYGVELAFGSERERTVEYANTSYWIGRAEERGIRVHRPELSALARHPYRYGFEYTPELEAVKDYTRVLRWSTRATEGEVEQDDAEPTKALAEVLRSRA